MKPGSTEHRVKELIAQMARLPESEIDTSRWPGDYGIDSLGLVVLRETLERVMQVSVSDDAWVSFESIGQLITFVDDQRARAAQATTQTPDDGLVRAADDRVRPRNGWWLTPDGVLYNQLDVGMPLTGRMNLAESPLLKHLGDLRWQHLSGLCGVPSRLIADAEGARLYPTFFYVEMAFPPDRPMAAFTENDQIKIASSMVRFGASMLDGVSYLLPQDYPETSQAPYDSVAAAVAAGIPAVRLSNIFVKQFSGAEWLKKSRPANPGFAAIRETAVAPDSYTAVKQAEKDGGFARPGAAYVPMTNGPVRTEYQLVPDRDLNGVGLVYFANYPMFLDICEREVLATARLALSHELIDKRTVVRRRSAYLNNASSRDRLFIEIEPWIENPVAAGHPAPEMAPVRLFINYKMYRRSDERLMMVSTAEKLIFGVACEELPLFTSGTLDACGPGPL